MELNELVIKQALLNKGVSAKQMCKEINFSEPSLYRFYLNGNMRESNKKKIRDYLGLDTATNHQTQVLQSINDSQGTALYWREKYFDVMQTVNDLTNTIQMLRLGKRKPVSFPPAFASMP